MNHNNFELLQLATVRLSQDGTIKDRLIDAWTTHLMSVDADELPDALRDDFESLCAAMHRETPLARESAVRASVRKMSVSEARDYAALVVRMFGTLARDETRTTVTRARMQAPALVQLFAAEA